LIDPATLRALAQAGIDAAKQAGASYADCRVSDWNEFETRQGLMIPPECALTFNYTYGLRVLVDGAWAQVFGADPTPDGIARAARTAVTTARGLSRIAGTPVELVPTPTVHGEWNTPQAIDPFSVSPDEHAQLIGAYKEASQRVPHASTGELRFQWGRDTRVFASTDGSLITQCLRRWRPIVMVAAFPRFGREEFATLPVPGISPMSIGFEAALGSEIQERIKATAEEVTRLVQYPEGEAKLGRYAAVLDGEAMGLMLGATLSPALEVDRVLGYEANNGGTSILAPASEFLGTPIGASVIDVTADRTAPHYGAARWDDEGVKTQSFPVIQQGRLRNYFTTRTSVLPLAAAVTAGSQPTVYGSAVAWTLSMKPIGSASHLTMASGPVGATLDSLVQDLGTGMLIYGARDDISTDSQLAGGLLQPQMLFEVQRGTIVRRLRHGGIQFGTKTFWKGVAALGDTTTVLAAHHAELRGEMAGWSSQVMHAPAALARQVDVIQIGRNR